MTDVADAPTRRSLTKEEIAAAWPNLDIEARRQIIEQTAHVHDVAHAPVITTEPLAHLKESAAKGAKELILQPRHNGNAFTVLTVGTERVEVASVEPGRIPKPGKDAPMVDVVEYLERIHNGREIDRTIVHLKTPLKHSHEAGVAVAAEGYDPENTDASGVICHDCTQHLASDRGSERILVCPRVHGIRPPSVRPKHEDGAVECGLPSA